VIFRTDARRLVAYAWAMRALLLLALCFGIGCERSKAPERSSPDAGSVASPAPEATLGGPSATPPGTASAPPNTVSGAVSEEEFKRWHTLKADAAPPGEGSSVELSDGSTAYLSLPSGRKPPLAGLVVIHEWWGLNDHIKHYADRFAKLGYAALAVDLFQEQVATTPDAALKLVKSVDDARAKRTLLAARKFLTSDPRVKAERTGAVGWCFGGKYSLEFALAEPALDAAVIYYGHVPTDAGALAKLKTPVLAIFGTRDASIPRETVDAFRAGLEKAEVPHQVITFDAEHAFANPSGERYDEKSAAAAWSETRTFLAQYLGT
jgi:carboxymethylenebutenolidase